MSKEIDDLIKELKDDGAHCSSEEAKEFLTKNLGKKCKIRHTEFEGIIHSLNLVTDGFYPCDRYPINIEITNGRSKGTIFEYSINRIEMVY